MAQNNATNYPPQKDMLNIFLIDFNANSIFTTIIYMSYLFTYCFQMYDKGQCHSVAGAIPIFFSAIYLQRGAC